MSPVSSVRSMTPKRTGLNSDFKYCAFTTKEQSNLLVVSEVPVKGSVIQDQLVDSRDVKQFV
jgi:hypothetical protein